MTADLAPSLPIDPVLPGLAQVLAAGRNAVLEAPPGAGKTTRVPLALLEAPWLAGRRIVMLEPRRLAARAAAHHMARTLGESVGGTVGYRVRLDSRVGPDTRIEVVTEGILTRRLQADPGLAGVGLVIFDEFHERSLQADLGLALCLEAQGALREDLRLLVMSATLDGAAVAALLGDAPVVRSAGRSFPVAVRHLPGAVEPVREGRVDADAVAGAVRRALAEEAGSVLVFLPGGGEIAAVGERLAEDLPATVDLAPLYGDLDPRHQEQAIRPAPAGRRKVVLATNIAETSLTIEGIRVVVDAGLMRVARFEPRTGMTRLQTVPVSQASAAQRCGRAGRLEPGVCYRLWSEARDKALPPFNPPEILAADLAPLVLELAQWGVTDPAALAWLDPPPAAGFAQARELLTALGALDTGGRITAHGRALGELAMHPRLAHMVLRGRDLGAGALACELAALLGERDLLRGRERDADLQVRLEVLRHPGGAAVDRGALQRVREQAGHWRRQLGLPAPPADGSDLALAGVLLAFAYPDRIARRRAGPDNRFLLANGRGAVFPRPEPLAAADWLVAAHLDAGQREARIYLAAPVDRDALLEHCRDRIAERRFVTWDAGEGAVLARCQLRLGELVLTDESLADPDPAALRAAMLAGIRQLGSDALPWTRELRNWQARVQFLHRLAPADWPDVSDAALMARLDDWLEPFLTGVTRTAHLARVNLAAALGSLLPWDRARALDAEAPTHVTVPSGSRIPVDYGQDPPVLAVRLQELFGCVETPRIAGGRVALVLHLLSPARRPVQVTRDLASFWAGAYHEVKKDLKGRYPKHHWPDDPLAAPPTSRTKRRS